MPFYLLPIVSLFETTYMFGEKKSAPFLEAICIPIAQIVAPLVPPQLREVVVRPVLLPLGHEDLRHIHQTWVINPLERLENTAGNCHHICWSSSNSSFSQHVTDELRYDGFQSILGYLRYHVLFVRAANLSHFMVWLRCWLADIFCQIDPLTIERASIGARQIKAKIIFGLAKQTGKFKTLQKTTSGTLNSFKNNVPNMIWHSFFHTFHSICGSVTIPAWATSTTNHTKPCSRCIRSQIIVTQTTDIKKKLKQPICAVDLGPTSNYMPPSCCSIKAGSMEQPAPKGLEDARYHGWHLLFMYVFVFLYVFESRSRFVMFCLYVFVMTNLKMSKLRVNVKTFE